MVLNTMETDIRMVRALSSELRGYKEGNKKINKHETQVRKSHSLKDSLDQHWPIFHQIQHMYDNQWFFGRNHETIMRNQVQTCFLFANNTFPMQWSCRALCRFVSSTLMVKKDLKKGIFSSLNASATIVCIII